MKSLFLLTASAGIALSEPALTLYNQNFAVVRESIPLDLKKGENTVTYANATAHIEPSSVVLRNTDGDKLLVLEQNYRNDPVSQSLLLSLFEGRTIDFLVRETQKPDRIIQGKIIRSGYQLHHQQAMQRYGQHDRMNQMAMAGGTEQPIIEVDGKLQFSLPGQPIFPSLGDDTILKPSLTWTIESAGEQKLNAELAYITGGMSWEADYNLVLPEKGDRLALIGWITMDNQSGRTFSDAKIKLMAGDVSKIQPPGQELGFVTKSVRRSSQDSPEPQVTEKTFDEYHLYELTRKVTLRDRETKQVEFLNAPKVEAKTIYVYDGAIFGNRYRGWDYENIRTNPEYGTETNKKVWVMREFRNSRENGLGIPLPKGRMRFYRQDTGGQMEFIGENEIDHTPKDELVRAYTGNAFDLVGERVRTDFKVNTSEMWADETFRITVRNRKDGPVEIRVVEHLYRWTNWEIVEKSMDFTKKDSQTIEFTVPLKAGEEKSLTYKVHYSW